MLIALRVRAAEPRERWGRSHWRFKPYRTGPGPGWSVHTGHKSGLDPYRTVPGLALLTTRAEPGLHSILASGIGSVGEFQNLAERFRQERKAEVTKMT